MNEKKNARPSWYLGRATERSAYLLYQNCTRLSMEIRELIIGSVGVCVFIADVAAFPSFVGLLCGAEMARSKIFLAVFFAAQAAAVALLGLRRLCQVARDARKPKRLGVIPSETIRRIMGVKWRE